MPITDQDRERIARKSRRLTLQHRDRRQTAYRNDCDRDGRPYQPERPVGQPHSGTRGR
jgi:hypothetical protein